MGQRKMWRKTWDKILPSGYFWHARCIEYCAKSKDCETVPGMLESLWCFILHFIVAPFLDHSHFGILGFYL